MRESSGIQISEAYINPHEEIKSTLRLILVRKSSIFIFWDF